MKNVLQVMPEFGIAGAEIMCENLVYGLTKLGNYRVVVASLYNYHSTITNRLENNGIKLYYLEKKAGIDIRIIIRLAKIMKKEQIDIVHTHRYTMQYAIPAAFLAGVKVRIHTVHNIAEKEVDSTRQKIANFFYKHCNVTPVSISPIVQSTVLNRYNLNSEQSPVVYNGIDLSRCHVKTDYNCNGIFRFIHIGRFSQQKNHEIMLKAAARMAKDGLKFQIQFVGGAGNEEERQEQVHNLGLDDYFIFSGIQTDVFSLMYDADCFILPSLYEGMPVTLVEAMGCGLPIIASAVGGVPDMITNEVSGLLIQPTVDDLQFAMKRIILDEKLRARLGRSALEKSKRFSAKEMCKGYVRIYEYGDEQ